MTIRSIGWRIPTLSAIALALAACGAGGGGGGASAASGGNGSLSLAIMDAPADDVREVWVQFTGVRVKPREGNALSFPFSTPLTVDLLTLTGANSVALLDNQAIPAGEYDWIALDVNANFDNVFDSYLVDGSGGQVELRVPSGDQQGLRLVSGFTVTANGDSSFVIDWDLRKGLTKPNGQAGYFLRPALRITDLTTYGSIRGTVADALVMDETCTSLVDEDKGNLVYIYEGANVTPVDIDGTDPEPLVTAPVTVDPNAAGAYTYSVQYLSPGNYTLAFTCHGIDDDPAAANADLVFVQPQTATVVDGGEAVVDFTDPPPI